MLAEDIIAEHELKRERESFMKRKFGLVKKAEQLRRVWPPCEIEQKILDRATGLWYVYRSAPVDFPSTDVLRDEGRIAELLGPQDFETDNEDSNNDDGDSSGETKVPRRKLKNIRPKKRSRQNTPKKKPTIPRASASRTAQPSFQIKDVLSMDKQDQIGTRRIIPSGSRRLKADMRKSQKGLWALPPIPIFKTLTDCDIPELVL